MNRHIDFFFQIDGNCEADSEHITHSYINNNSNNNSVCSRLHCVHYVSMCLLFSLRWNIENKRKAKREEKKKYGKQNRNVSWVNRSSWNARATLSIYSLSPF